MDSRNETSRLFSHIFSCLFTPLYRLSSCFWFNWPAASAVWNYMFTLWKYRTKQHTMRDKTIRTVEFMIWWELCATILCVCVCLLAYIIFLILNAQIYIVSWNVFVLVVMLAVATVSYTVVVVIVGTKLYITKQMKTRQSNKLHFGNICERTVHTQLILYEPKPRQNKNWRSRLKKRTYKHTYTTLFGSSERLATHLQNLRCFVFSLYSSRKDFFLCCGCKKSCPKSEIDLICSLYSIVILLLLYCACGQLQSYLFNRITLRKKYQWDT